MAQGSIVKRCPTCGNRSKAPCGHKEARYAIVYWAGGRQRWETVGPNRHVAERRLAEVMARIHSGAFREVTPVLFRDFAKRWLEQRSDEVKPATLRSYRWLVSVHLVPAFGQFKLTDLTTEVIEKFLAEKRKAGLSAATVRHLLVVIKMMLKLAKRWGYVSQNPTQDIKAPKVSPREMDYLNPEEIRRLLNHADEPYRTLFLTAVLTGMRRGELLALQWGDIDWSQQLIYVQRSVFWRSADEVGPKESRYLFQRPKTVQSKRMVPVSPMLREALEVHRLNTLHRANPHDMVFTSPNGQPLDPDLMVRSEFLPVLGRAGLRKVRFHDLRHTAASLLIAQGEHPKTIQGMLGHASSRTTFDVYGHLYPATLQAVGPKLDAQVLGTDDRNPANTLLTSDPEPPPNNGNHPPNGGIITASSSHL